MSVAAQRFVFALAVIAVLAGLAHFVRLRFQSGELYPDYSTFRAEPDGVKALFESLKKLEHAPVRRNVDRLDALRPAPGETAVFLGGNEFDFQVNEDLIRHYARDGARIVLALDSRSSRRASAQKNSRLIRRTFPPAGSTNTNAINVSQARQLFGVDVGVIYTGGASNKVEAVRANENEALPQMLPWYGRFYFTPPSNNWETVYAVSNRAVVLQKKVGLGSVVLFSDSYPFSNEALRLEAQPELLLWAFGDGPTIFDETHLGLQRGSGLAVMMREFRLGGLAVACLLLGGLWIWRSSSTLVPPNAPATPATVESIEGKTAREAIVHLLRRNLSDVEVLRAGLDEWARMHPPKFYWQTVQLEEARQLVEKYANTPRPRDLAAMQRALSEHLYPKQNQT